MLQNCLPQIDVRIDKHNRSFQPIIHSLNHFSKRKSITNQRYDWLKNTAMQGNQHIEQFVRASFNNKTALFKRKRINSIQNCHKSILAPLQCHQTKKIVIFNQSPRIQTEPTIHDLKGCKSLLNPKEHTRKSLLELGQKNLSQAKRKNRPNRSFIDYESLNNITPSKFRQQRQQYILCPWDDKQSDNGKQNKLLRFR